MSPHQSQRVQAHNPFPCNKLNSTLNTRGTCELVACHLQLVTRHCVNNMSAWSQTHVNILSDHFLSCHLIICLGHAGHSLLLIKSNDELIPVLHTLLVTCCHLAVGVDVDQHPQPAAPCVHTCIRMYCDDLCFESTPSHSNFKTNTHLQVTSTRMLPSKVQSRPSFIINTSLNLVNSQGICIVLI